MRLVHSLFSLLLLVNYSLQQDTQCDANRLCEIGCCSSAGFCGLGPDYCGKGCQSTCDAKADCNPGWSSTEYSLREKCPLNVCCSEHGFCGTTEEFCKDDKVKRPSCALGKSVNRVMGYFESWSMRERSCFNMRPEAVPYGLYTDIIFSFATINPNTYKVTAGSSQVASDMRFISTIKMFQPSIRIWIALGGWAFNDPGPTQTTFSDIAASESKTKIFLDSLVSMMTEYSFDGVDIDWEYPVAEDRNGGHRPQDYKNIVTFMKRLRSRMSKLKKKTSMAIPASYWYLQNFDIKALEETVDWFNIMSYDVHGSWDIDNEWTGPWANSHTNMTEIQQGLDLLWRNDINPAKVTMGMSYYSRTFTLTDPKCNGLGCRVSSAGNPGRCSDTAGVLLHPEIAEIVKEKALSPQLHRDAAVKTISWGNQWTSFDDLATWRLKANMARSQCIDGFMVWAMSHDDKSHTNAKALNQALGRKVPVQEVIRPGSGNTPEASMEPKLCRWTSCFEECPAGFKAVRRDGHKEIMLDSHNCQINFGQGAVKIGKGMMKFCCPAEQPQPKCTWRGYRKSNKCQPGCEVGEAEVGTLRAGCIKGFQTACCEMTDVTSAYGECVWMPCGNGDEGWSKQCPGNFPHFLVASSDGSGDMGTCKGKQKRVLCCPRPPPAGFDTKCGWHKNVIQYLGETCDGSCPKDSVRVGLELGSKQGESCRLKKAFCCSDPTPPPKDDGSGKGLFEKFKVLLSDFIENDTCPNLELDVFLPDSHHDYGVMKRSLKAESREHEVRQQRAAACTEDNWFALLWLVTPILLNRYDNVYEEMGQLWDDEFAGRYDEALEVNSLNDYLLTYEIEPSFLAMSILLDPMRMGPEIREMRQSTSDLCVLPDDEGDERIMGVSGLSPHHQNGTLEDRRVKVPGTNGVKVKGHIPSWATILQGILGGQLQLHYARWQWYRGTNSVQRVAPGPMLELAYWIGPPGSEGVTPGNSAGWDQFRDTTPARSYTVGPTQGPVGPSNWVVLHLHVNATTGSLYLATDPTAGGNSATLLGVTSITIFHGQTWGRTGSGDWRVNNNIGGSGVLGAPGSIAGQPGAIRANWFCPPVRGSPPGMFFIGGAYPGGARVPWQQDMVQWGQDLYNSGIAGVNGLRLLHDPPQGGVHGVIEPMRANPPLGIGPGTLTRSTPTVASRGRDPYRVNYLVRNNGAIGGYTFGIRRPDPRFQQ